MATQRAGRALATVTGGAGFDDADDLQLALKTAEEDSQNAYSLGYYPAEEALDGKYHRLTVVVSGEKSARLEARYRPGYVATRQEVAKAAPPPGLYQVRVTVDLHDVHLEREGSRSVGRIEVAFPFGAIARVRTIGIDLADDQLAADLRTGFVITASGIEASGESVRVVVRDPSTGVAGSLRIPLR